MTQRDVIDVSLACGMFFFSCLFSYSDTFFFSYHFLRYIHTATAENNRGVTRVIQTGSAVRDIYDPVCFFLSFVIKFLVLILLI